jgi:3-methyladenine DNA glycosylase Tag
MTSFDAIYSEALFRQCDEGVLKSKLPVPRTSEELRNINDADYLSVMSRRIFRAGLRHSMVDAKWPAFENIFHGFEIGYVRMMSDDDLEKLMKNEGIIRHWGKIKSVRANAQAIYELQNEKGSLGHYIADWPCNQIVGLWVDLKKRFTQLGGQSGPYFLRMAGKDTFLLTTFVVKGLIKWGLIESVPKGIKGQQVTQAIFNQWNEESGRPLCQLSMILALSTD